MTSFLYLATFFRIY